MIGTTGRPPLALTVAGSDPAGGAGIQADLKVFAAHGVFGLSVLTAVIAQATRGVRSVWPVPADMVRAQLEVVLDDVGTDVVKSGALISHELVTTVVDVLGPTEVPWIVDPVLVSSSGRPLLDEAGRRVLVERLLPRATLITPNAPELAALLGEATAPGDLEGLVRSAERLHALGGRAVLAKGGHLHGDPVDVLVTEAGTFTFGSERIETSCVRGTGCTLSSAIAARLARGDDLLGAVVGARAYLQGAMRSATPVTRPPSGRSDAAHDQDRDLRPAQDPLDHFFAGTSAWPAVGQSTGRPR